MRTPQEPQMPCWQEQRIPIDPSSSPLILRIASSTELRGGRSTTCSSQWAAWPDCGSKRRILSVYSGIGSVGPFLRLPLGDGDLGVAHLRHVVTVDGDVDVLEPLLVVALRE